jgi:hypothetical protein
MLTFLKRVKEGEYAPIEESSLKYVRMKEHTIVARQNCKQYHYSMS